MLQATVAICGYITPMPPHLKRQPKATNNCLDAAPCKVRLSLTMGVLLVSFKAYQKSKNTAMWQMIFNGEYRAKGWLDGNPHEQQMLTKGTPIKVHMGASPLKMVVFLWVSL